jgi:3'5'-cyclic nucleotide phosphodiesterase
MSRIVPPSNLAEKAAHDHTFGISADPLTRFACAFSALIHDVDHTGVSNAQLVKDQVPIAKKYNERRILMEDDYKDLRALLFQSQADLIRFRQLVVNVSSWKE